MTGGDRLTDSGRGTTQARFGRRSALAGLAVLPAVGAATTGCGPGVGSTAAAADEPGILKIAMTAGNIPFPSTPPNQGYEGYRFVGNNLYDGLTRLNLEQDKTIPTPHPSLASSWTRENNDQLWTFTLRRDVRFHDGQPFDADAVVFQFNRLKDDSFAYYDETSAANASALFRYVKSWRKVDRYTFQITTTQPYALLLWDLTSIYFPSPAVVKRVGNEDYNQHAVGTGPFTMTRYVDGEVMELTRNPDYWAGPAKLRKIILYPQPEPASRLAMLQSGEVNWAEVPDPDSLSMLKNDGFVITMGKYPHGIMPRLNLFREPFKGNLKLRQALNYAIDRDGTAALINDTGYPARQYVYPGHPAYAEGVGFDYDVAKARQLLADSGHRPGELQLTMAYPTGGSGNMYPSVMMQKLQADFAAIGVDLALMPLEWTTIISIGLERLNSPQWKDIDILWASPAAGMMPTGYSSTFLSRTPAGQPNATGLDDAAVDRSLGRAIKQPEVADQNRYLQAMMREATEQAEFLFWMHDLNLRVMSTGVTGYVQVQSWWVDFTLISVE
ncbi:ABC transporter substrate-binding protein [Microlunatus soli]|uniref:Peptide/nickel transport system substrate-binding protein n=1 Tax=Microlunatus soli TaxID=630515 RepID=A0A1H1MUQ5_9ACTN|nr:ABC transporter substrate-binding protein [Microlunatus soli]SDR90631.1 peptide/nickel transport system substrate-binding protein [Microlunatus soli]